MRIFDKIESYVGHQPVVLSIGNFDGLHRGHQYLLQKNLDLAAPKGANSMVLSFFPHPMQVLRPESFCALGTRTHQGELLEQMGIDAWIIEPFSSQAREESAESFWDRILKFLPVCAIVVGPDFRFGKDRQGDVKFLQSRGNDRGIEICVPPPYLIQGQRVSSSEIRRCLQRGDVEKAAEFLGRPFSIEGKVITGFRRGHKLGFPTANIASAPAKNLRLGSYATVVHALGQTWKAATNVGLHPTFGEEVDIKVETHILDFSQNLYGEEIRLEFIKFLRPECRFKDVEALVEQIKKDIEVVRAT